MRKRDDELHRRRRDQILDAACGCFIEKGLHETSVQEICKAAGLSPGQLYRSFESKEAIILAIAEQEREEALKLVNKINDHRDNLPKGLMVVMPGLIEDITDEDYAFLMLELASEANKNQALSDIFVRIENEVSSCLTGAITASQRAGTVKKELDPSATTYLLLSLLDGISERSTFVKIKNRKALTKTMKQFVEAFLSTKTSKDF